MFQSFHVITLILGLNIDNIRAQTGGSSANGDIWSCVPAGFCDNNVSPTSPGIDPRIVTPGAPCPAGTIQCITQGPSSKCGQRFVDQTRTTDGPADNGAYPWQAFIRNATHPVYAGSGVLLDNYHILTAAHKVAPSVNNPGSVTVFMGVYDPSNLANTQNRTAAAITVHPSYNPSTLFNDIAIITVNPPFALSAPNINTACLPAAGGATAFVGQNCVVAGWGETSFTLNDQPVNPMKQVYVGIVDYNTCRTAFASADQLSTNVDVYLDPAGEICAGGQAMRDACTYDGGAPLICPATGAAGNIAGLVIWGKGCGQAGVYGVYVGVPYYRGWIDTTLAALNAG